MSKRRETKSFPIAGIKSVDVDTGSFEAIVSVFGNIDYHGHRIAADAFDGSIERLQAAGDPIPVIFSHQWDDLDAYLGTVDPANLKALPPGDPELPELIREFGGLYVKGEIDTTEPGGRKALKLLKSRAIREFSFAYEVLDEAKADDGFVDLLELDLFELGPTLKGANPLTQLVGAKAAKDRTTIGETLAKVAEVLGTESNTIAEILGVDVAAPPAADRGAKAFVSLPGTVERLQEAIVRQAMAWAADTYGDNLYTVQLEGTYPADGRAVIYVELWDDPPYKGRFFELSFEADGDGLSIGEPELVELVAAVAGSGEKARGWSAIGVKAGARNNSEDLDRIQGVHDLSALLGATCGAESDEEGAEDDDADDEGTEARTFGQYAAPATVLANVEAELLEL